MTHDLDGAQENHGRVRRCLGILKNWRRCGRFGPWRFYCDDHRWQPLQAIVFAVFTLLAGIASIESAWLPGIKEHAIGVVNSLFAYRNTPKAQGNRLAIYVARFGDDGLSTIARERVIASIRTELGPARVEVLPAGITLAPDSNVSDDSADEKATSEARSLLKIKHGDLLIWGRIYNTQGMKPVLDLRFVSADTAKSGSEPFGLTDKWMLDAEFGPEMGTALAAVACAVAASVVRDAGQYLVSTLVPVADRLAPLVRNIPG